MISIEEKNTLTQLAPNLKLGQNLGPQGKRYLSMFQIFEEERFRNEYKMIRDYIIRSIYPVFDAYKETEYVKPIIYNEQNHDEWWGLTRSSTKVSKIVTPVTFIIKSKCREHDNTVISHHVNYTHQILFC